MTHCILIPTYNNATTLFDVVSRVLAVCGDVLVVNDGSTDATMEVLQPLEDRIHVISYERNKGKGYALRKGFEWARANGYDYAITIDSDGQHNPGDIPLLVQAIKQSNNQAILVVGSRNLAADGMPAQNSFANRFSNFWFLLQTGTRLPDTQTGFRAYPLKRLPCLKLMLHRYESELQLLVLSAWKGVRLVPKEVSVRYAPDRVTHFRPFMDFFRISILNTVLCLLALVYGWPRMAIQKMKGGSR